MRRPVDQLTPIHQENEQISRADGAVAVQIGWTVITIIARPPTGKEDQQIARADCSVTVNIAGDDGTDVKRHRVRVLNDLPEPRRRELGQCDQIEIATDEVRSDDGERIISYGYEPIIERDVQGTAERDRAFYGNCIKSAGLTAGKLDV